MMRCFMKRAIKWFLGGCSFLFFILCTSNTMFLRILYALGTAIRFNAYLQNTAAFRIAYIPEQPTAEQTFKRFFGYDRCAFILIDLFAGNLFKISDREDNRCTLRIRCQQITAATVFAVRADRTFQIKSVTPGSSGQTKEKIQCRFILLHCAPSLSIYYFLKKIPRTEEKRQTPNDVCRQF